MTLLRRGWGGCGLFPAAHRIDGANEQEDGEGNDQEADDGVQEDAVVDGHSSRRLGLDQARVGARSASLLEDGEEAGKVDTTQQEPNGRHQNVLDKALDNGAKGTTDDDPYRH